MKGFTYLAGGALIVGMLMPLFTEYIPNKEVIPLFYYIFGFLIAWMWKEEGGKK